MKRRLIGVIVVVALAAGVLLGKFGMPGLGSGDGGSGLASDSPPSVNVKPTQAVKKQAEASLSVVEQGTLMVRVQDKQFLVRGSDGTFTAATIEEVVERAKAIRPNSSGIRVCIRREASARAGAWGELVEQLKANGVDGDQIDWGNDQVP